MQIVDYMLSKVFYNLSNFILCNCGILCQDLMDLRSTDNTGDIKIVLIV